MSDSSRDTSVRQLPPGKLQNIKKLFEDGEKDKTDKPLPPARPQALPTKFGSPVRQPAVKKYPAPQAPGSQLKQLGLTRNLSDGENREEFKNRKFSGDSGQSHQGAQQSSKVAERISCLETAVSSQGNSTSTASSSGTFQLKAGKSQPIESGGNGPIEAVNGPQGIKVQRTQSDVSDLYAQVNKPDRNPESHKVTIQPKSDLQRKEAVRKNSDERRKTVAAFSCEVSENIGTNVASRSRFFDGQKPSPPVKPEAVKRQHSMRTAQELGRQKSLETEGNHEGDYNIPWDLSKNSAVERLMNQCKPSSSATSAANATKSDPSTQKPPLPNQPPKLLEAKSQRPHNREAGNKVRKNSGQSKILENTPDQPEPAKAAAPPKPPRTHAHDDYLKIKNAQSESKPKSDALVKKASGADGGRDIADAEYLSVKDRITKIRQQTSSPPLSSNKDQGVLMRQPPPSRPPPPRLRPSSGGTPTKEMSWPAKPRPVTHAPATHQEGPVIIPLSPNSQKNSATLFNSKAGRSQDSSDKSESGSGKRFPLRKSYSSECLHSSRGSSLNAEDDSGMQMTHSTYVTDYEAVLDPDGYAIPHEFMKIKRKRQFSGQNDDVGPMQKDANELNHLIQIN
ncbi:hypothetical protein Btru_018567 [Bulinus truncatus]|nr:hypothetical protein Btru_018567 [Bulinus truncatus]